MLDPAWLMRLPKGQAFALLEGGRLVKLRIPLPLPAQDADVPATWTAMLERMRTDYDGYLQRTPDSALTVEGAGGGY